MTHHPKCYFTFYDLIATHTPPPPTERDFEGPHSKFSAQGPEFLATALCKSMVFGVKSAVINIIINR